MNGLKLDRPLVIVDTETTGVEKSIDRIVQIAAIRIEPCGTTEEQCLLVNPGVPIPPEATAIHGITDARVVAEPKFPTAWALMRRLIEGADFCAYNAPFDLGMIEAECKRAGLPVYKPERVIDPLVIFRRLVPHTLEGALKYFAGLEHEDAHDASGDCNATLHVLQCQAFEAQASLDQLVEMSKPEPSDRWCDSERRFYWRFHEPTFAFGKCQGQPLARVAKSDRSYLDWMVKQDFAPDVKALIQRALRGESLKREVSTDGVQV